MSNETEINIKIIKEVEKRPCLWDSEDQFYNQKVVKLQNWQEIADKVGESAKSCKERWRNMRNTFNRSLKQPKNGSSHSTKKVYYLAHYLKFLLPVLKHKNPESRLEESIYSLTNNQNIKTEEIFIDQSSNIVQNEIENEESILSSKLSSSPSCSYSRKSNAKKRKIDKTKVDEAFINRISNKSQKTSIEESNSLFLQSLVYDLNKMNESQNRRFRQKVIGLIDDVLNNKDLYAQTSFQNPSNICFQKVQITSSSSSSSKWDSS